MWMPGKKGRKTQRKPGGPTNSFYSNGNDGDGSYEKDNRLTRKKSFKEKRSQSPRKV